MSPPVKLEEATPETIAEFLIQTLRPYRVDDTTPISTKTTIEQVGIDSFDFVEILFKIEDHYGIDLDFNANMNFDSSKTIEDLAAEIAVFKAQKVAA